MNLHSQVYSTFDADTESIIAFIQWLVRSYGLREPVRVLDIGCGPGRMLSQYARLGWQAVGMEPNPDFYTQAIEETKFLTNITVKAGGFGDIEYAAAFEVVTAINGPFAYLLSPQEQRDALKQVFKALKPNGIMFIDIPNLLWFLKNGPEITEDKKTLKDQEVQLLKIHKFDVQEATFTQINKYTVKDDLGEETKLYETHKHAVITFPELAYLVEACGFKEIRTYNCFESRQSEPLTGSRIMFSAQKPH